MTLDDWQVLTLVYFLEGLWFIVSGAAYASNKLSLQFLAIAFYQELAVNVALNFIVSRGSISDAYPTFLIQGLASVSVFMLYVSKHKLTELTVYEFAFLYVLPVVICALFAYSRFFSLTNILISIGVGSVNGFLKAWLYKHVIKRVFASSTYFTVD